MCIRDSYETFPTSDGFVNIAVGNDGLWKRFTDAMGMADTAADPRFVDNAGRITNLPALREIITARFASQTTDEIVATLDAAAVPSGPVSYTHLTLPTSDLV